MLGPSALSQLIRLVARMMHHVCRGKQFFVKSFNLPFQSTTIVVLIYMFVLDKRNTLWLRNKIRQTSLGKSAARPKLRSSRWPLTSFGISAWPYCVTTKYSYYLSFCHSVLEYTASIRYPHLVKDKNSLKRVQRRASRFVCVDYRTASNITSMLDWLGWKKKIQDQRRELRLALLYKIVNGHVVVSADDIHLTKMDNWTRTFSPIGTYRSGITSLPQ